MAIPAQLQSLETFLQASPPPGLILAIAAGQPDSLVLQQVNITQQVANSLRSIPRSLSKLLNGAVLRPYEAGYKPDAHEILTFDLDANAQVGSIVQSLSSIGNLELFEATDELLAHLRFYVIATESAAAERALFFKRTSSKMELSRRFPHRAILRAGQYSGVNERVLLFEESIDCFVWNDVMYITRPTQFNAIFGFFEQLRARGGETLNKVLQRVPISNGDAFRDACLGQIQMLAKLSSISSKPYFSSLSMSRVKDIIAAYRLDLQMGVDANGREALVFDSHPQRRWLILKVLDDDYLSSEMTALRYEVNSKSNLV